jgi:hypothetical protein
MESKLQTASRLPSGAFSLACMFQILTACCVFFACLKVSPLLAIIGTVVGTPALIRTGVASDLHRQSGKPFSWPNRLLCFLESIGIEMAIGLFAFLVFALISVLFGAIAVGFSLLYGVTDQLSDIAVVGTAGGMIWGFAGALLAFGLTAKFWKVTSHLNAED